MGEPKKGTKFKEGLFSTVLIGLLILISFFCIRYYVVNRSGFSLLIPGVLSGVTALSLITLPFNHLKIVKGLHWLIGWVVGIPYFLGVIFTALTSSLFTTAIVFVLIMALISLIISGLGLFGIQIDIEIFKKSILYFTSLSTALIISYFGDRLMLRLYGILLDDGETKEVVKTFGVRVYRLIDYRRRVYEFSIFLYVFSVIERLSGLDLITWSTWLNYKEVALEILLSFVAVDAYVQTYFKNKKTKKQKKGSGGLKKSSNAANTVEKEEFKK